MVIQSALVRGALTAITWLFRSEAPQRYVGTMLEAWDYCARQLTTNGIVVPATMATYRAALAGHAA
jgi:hypothetical protein